MPMPPSAADFTPAPVRFRRRLLLIGLLAVGVRLLFLWQVRASLAESPADSYLQGEPGVSHAAAKAADESRGYALRHGTDMLKYVRYARLVLRGRWQAENPTISPLGPLVWLPLLLGLTGGGLVAAMALQALAGGLTVGLIGLIGRRYLSPAGALLAALGAALYVPLIVYDTLPLTEAVINLALLLAVGAFLRLRERPTVGRAGIFGLALGMALLAKPSLLVLPAALALGDAYERGLRNACRLWPQWGAALLTALLVISPYLYRARQLSGEWLFLRGNTSYMVLMGNHPAADGGYRDVTGPYARRLAELQAQGLSLDAASGRLALTFWREQPGQALALFFRKAARYCWPEEPPNNVSLTYYRQISFLGWPVWPTATVVFPLAALGLVAAWPERRRWAVPLAVVGVYSLTIISTVILARLRLAVVPLLVWWAAAGALWLYGQGRELDRRRGAALALLLAAVLAAGAADWQRQLTPLWSPDGRLDPPAAAGLDFSGQLLRDGAWTDDYPYGTTLEPGDEALKELILPEFPAGPSWPCLVWRGGLGGNGEVEISVNGRTLTTRLPVNVGDDWQTRRTYRLPLARAWLSPGANRFGLRPRPGTWLRVALDDGPWYGRSACNRNGPSPQGENLDGHAGHPICWTYRAARLPRGEFQIGLLIPR